MFYKIEMSSKINKTIHRAWLYVSPQILFAKITLTPAKRSNHPATLITYKLSCNGGRRLLVCRPLAHHSSLGVLATRLIRISTYVIESGELFRVTHVCRLVMLSSQDDWPSCQQRSGQLNQRVTLSKQSAITTNPVPEAPTLSA